MLTDGVIARLTLAAPALPPRADAGDSPAMPDTLTLAELHRRHADDVYRFAYWLCGNPHDARDITSETFVRAWTNTTEIRALTAKAFLFTIARNVHRQRGRTARREVAFDDTAHDAPAATLAPDRTTAARDELARTFAALDQLPETDRAVLLMRAQGDLSDAEIAEATGLPVAAVRVKIFRARAKLSSLLQPATPSSP